ncbi:DeoR family transcriptional regulator [Herbiconiux flava]|uniref:Lactose phosphotransferase system repressor n=1 Tax=Herbiconiux flava TaxID=881268 RepID=A0A852SQ47_9MICO|nr:DeoR family transcriptional regulator [Herbiconiux flava]NYD70904.1 DeoR family fructose operon transcriptional repressor [Herbiconiux flava]GLK19134.1 D-beta-D-heptose 1-phosphate adenosyltransferase [Herbiconiux flava]
MSGVVLSGSAVAERRGRIVTALASAGRVDVGELATALGVAEETVRRDLRALETEGLLRRAHGGAIPVEAGVEHPEPDGAPRAIAESVRELVPIGSSLYLDAGPVGEALAGMLDVTSGVRIVTASVAVALAAALVPEPTETHLLGGAVGAAATASGHWTRELARSVHVDVAVLEPLGLGGVELLAADPDRAAVTAAIASVAGTVVMVMAARSDDGLVVSVGLDRVAHAVVVPGVLDTAVLRLLAEQGTPVTEVAA